jgi:hypothetical protein
MSKRQYDHIENKIREAAENNEPAFEEQAWDKMEAKLNAEKERRRSPFLWFSLALLSFGLLGGIIILHNRSTHDLSIADGSSSLENASKEDAQSAASFNNSNTQAINKEYLSADNKTLNKSGNIDQKNNQLAVQNNTDPVATNVPSTSNNAVIQPAKNDQSVGAIKSRKNTVSNINIIVANKSARIHISNKKENEMATDNNKAVASSTVNKKYAKRNSSINNDKVAASDNSISYSSSQKNKRNISGHTRTKIKAADQANDVTEDATFDKEVAAAVNNNSNNKSQLSKTDKDKKKDSIQKLIPKDTVAIQSTKKEIKKESIQKKTPWYVLASIGADASNVTLFSFNNSSITPRYGIGIGYQINKRISVQTGFYAGRKKYVAGPDDYNAKDPYLSTVDITKVTANCLIFEIPVTVRYNFVLRPKTTYYATAGLSSFIMKKEDYNYSYNTNYSTNEQVAHSYTGNKNLFSIATVSVGIERKISKAFSVQAEPSINIPIAGVGEGTVKLYSTDIQVGVKYNFHW